jgi:septal ring factor EnvC (AmiA/AmiB activator)
MNKITDRCSHDPKTYRENCILCVRNDNEDFKAKIAELEAELEKCNKEYHKMDDEWAEMEKITDEMNFEISAKNDALLDSEKENQKLREGLIKVEHQLQLVQGVGLPHIEKIIQKALEE